MVGNRDPWADAHGYIISPLRGWIMSRLHGSVATGREHVSPEGTACCSHGCKPVDWEIGTIAKPRRGDMS